MEINSPFMVTMAFLHSSNGSTCVVFVLCIVPNTESYLILAEEFEIHIPRTN